MTRSRGWSSVSARSRSSRPGDWVTVDVRAASLNHHDLWSLRGVGLPAERLPMILGCDAAGIDADGNEVIVHAVIASDAWRGDETLRPQALAAVRALPGDARRAGRRCRDATWCRSRRELSFEQAACLPTAWLTAYRMLFTRARLVPGQTVLVQGASGGVATALIRLASSAGVRVWATSRTEEKRAAGGRTRRRRTLSSPAPRLPERVDAVMETTGAATWSHSVRSLKPGGTIVISGATTGDAPPAELTRIFFLQLSVIGSTMGTRDELERLAQLMASAGVAPTISQTLPLADARAGFEAMLAGETSGKIVFTL